MKCLYGLQKLKKMDFKERMKLYDEMLEKVTNSKTAMEADKHQEVVNKIDEIEHQNFKKGELMGKTCFKDCYYMAGGKCKYLVFKHIEKAECENPDIVNGIEEEEN